MAAAMNGFPAENPSPRALPTWLTSEQREEAVAMFQDGFDTVDIASELGVRQSVVANAIGRR